MKPQDIEAARAVAFRFLGQSARSRAEIVRRLERDSFAPEIVDATVAELEAKGYLDDSQFAQAWISDRADRKSYGRARLAAELNRKGVDRQTIRETLDGVDDADELARALQAARSKWKPELLGSTDHSTELSAKRRIIAFLQRRGFSWSIIEQVLAKLMQNKS